MVRNAKIFDDLCAAAAVSLQDLSKGSAERTPISLRELTMTSCGTGDEGSPDGAIKGGPDSHASEIKVMEVDAFSSVHDMIHAAIDSYGVQATLRQVYQACQLRGRIAYKRAGGSRLITNNDHWKSQIRHALYTSDRFQRVAEGADMWMVTSQYRHIHPQTVKVLVRSNSNADSICDESQREPGRLTPARHPRRGTRAKNPPEQDLPFPTANSRKKRTSREMMALAAKSVPSPCQASAGLCIETIDECSHIDHAPSPLYHSQQGFLSSYPSNSQLEYSMTPSPVARSLPLEHSAWQKAAMHLTSTLRGSNGLSGLTCERSAEAESPAVFHSLYTLRSHSKPPPGFGSNPDPIAEKAAREAHAKTTGPLKKRLKAAAKAAAMVATRGGEEASSTQQRWTGVWTAPATNSSQHELKAGLNQLRPQSSIPQPPALPYLSRRQGEGEASDWDLAERGRSPGAMTGGASSMDALTHFSQQQPFAVARSISPNINCRQTMAGTCKAWSRNLESRLQGLMPFPQPCDVEEGADETDEGGGKRILRSHTAAAARDLDRENSVDRTKWMG